MRADDAQALALDHDFAAGGAARLERGQVERLSRNDLQIAPHQQGIAMPADAARALGHLDHPPARVVDLGAREHACAFADPPVGFLQRNDVRIDLVQD